MSARYILGMLLLVGCQQTKTPERNATALLIPPVSLPGPKSVPLVIRTPDLRVDFSLLELTEFYPPGALRIVGDAEYPSNLQPVSRVRFPSADPLWSPDGAFAVYTDGQTRNSGGRKVAKKNTREIFHWLMLHRKDALYPSSLYSTATAFELSWAPDGSRFVITDYVGNNSSEVHVFSTAPARARIDLGPTMRERFPSNAWEASLFVKAYRWSSEGKLVVRALGRAGVEPYELFGCEVVVDLTTIDSPLITFLRGFVLEQTTSDVR